MILQFDEIIRETPVGWWLKFDLQKVFISQSIGDINEQDKTVEVPNWLAKNEGLEGYEA